MKTSTLVLAAAIGAGALWLFQRTIDRGLSGTGQGSNPPRNDAAGPRLPAMPPMPNMPQMPRSGAAPNAPGDFGEMVEVGGSGWRELNRDLLRPLPAVMPMDRPPIRETSGWVDRTGNRPERNTDAATVFAAWARVQ